MKTPTIEEVKEFFKDAEIIKDYYNDILNFKDISEKGIYLFATEYYVNDKNGKDYVLWDEDYGYAEILKYKEKGDFKTITNSICDLLEYKNKKYGNSALEPLNIFDNKCKVGKRLDDKIARIKNSDTLQKNDVADLLGYLVLTCKEFDWNNFDEFKD